MQIRSRTRKASDPVYTRAIRYEPAESLQDACDALRRNGEGAKVIAGGQSLLPLINVGLAAPEVVVDISRAPQARDIVLDDGYLSIGALVTHRELAASQTVRGAQPLLSAAAGHIGNGRVRNRGTLGGSLAHGDPAAELPVVMAALGASYELTDGRGTRQLQAEDFAVTVFTTALEADELLVTARVPTLGPGWGWSFLEVSRRQGDFAIVSAAALVRSAAGTLVESRLALGGVADRPVRLSAVEASMSGAACQDIGDRVGQIEGIRTFGDTSASADYRIHLARVLAVRALQQAYRRSEEDKDGVAS